MLSALPNSPVLCAESDVKAEEEAIETVLVAVKSRRSSPAAVPNPTIVR